MFEDADNFADIFRGGLPYYLLLTLPILIICSSNPVLASSEFSVHRMSQFDLNGVSYGCRASALSLEAKSLYTWSTSRHCVVSKFQDLTIDQFNEIRQKAGGLVILLPKNIANLSFDEKEHLYLLEQAMLAQVSSIPVYFSTYNTDLEQVIEDITKSSDVIVKKGASRGSAISELLNSISANGYQTVVSGVTHSPNKHSKIPIIQGELAPLKNSKSTDGDINSKLPVILITAHLKTFGLYNEYPLNADAAVLFTIADLFSKLQNTENTAPKYKLMFLLTESGPLLNFQGSKKWLDDNVQLQEDFVSVNGYMIAAKKSSIPVQNVDFVICLDTISQPILTDSDSMYMHVSKPPKEGTAMYKFLKLLKSVGQQYQNMTVEGIHKKINLAEVQLAWEHERFSMKRLPAFTVSSVKSHKEPIRITIFKDDEEEILKNTKRNAKILIETLARYVYNINDGEIFGGTTDINKNMIKSLSTIKSALQTNDLKNGFEKYLKNVKIIYEKPDSRDPEFMLYGEGQEANLNVYRVKPAVFDLFLTFLIASYLTLVYLVIQFFPNLYTVVCKMTKNNVPKVKNN